MIELLFHLCALTLGYSGFIKTKSFAAPLTKEKELKALQALANGDKAARELLIVHNLRLVAHLVKKYDIQKECSEDLISIGTIGLIKAIDSYKLEKGIKLTTYASRCIENEILMYFRGNKYYYQQLSLDETMISNKDGSEVSLLETIADNTDIDIIKQMEIDSNCRKLKKYFYLLDEREQLILKKRFGLYGERTYKQKELAQELNISRSYISRIEKRAFIKLYKAFNKEKMD